VELERRLALWTCELARTGGGPRHRLVSTWRFGNRQNGHERIADLRLGWELPGDPITDNYTPDEIDAAALWSRWYKRYVEDDEPRIPELGAGWLAIYWTVMDAVAGVFEHAPFVPRLGRDAELDAETGEQENFLTFFTWPRDPDSDQPLRFTALEVEDKLWHAEPDVRADKGGFIQEHTGWKPSPLQPVVYVPALRDAIRG
jgi:hypothetical protein